MKKRAPEKPPRTALAILVRDSSVYEVLAQCAKLAKEMSRHDVDWGPLSRRADVYAALSEMVGKTFSDRESRDSKERTQRLAK